MHAPNTNLPAHIGLDKWSNIGFSWQGQMNLAEFERLSIDAQADAPLDVAVDFGKKDGILWLSFVVEGGLSLACQRCLSPLKVELSGTYQMAILTSDEQIERIAEQEYVLLSELGNPNLLPIKDLLEDELLLALPLSARHNDCQMFTDSVGDAITEEKASNPFAVLANLKSRPS